MPNLFRHPIDRWPGTPVEIFAGGMVRGMPGRARGDEGGNLNRIHNLRMVINFLLIISIRMVVMNNDQQYAKEKC